MRNIKNNFALKAFGSVAFVISASITVVSVVAIIYAMIYNIKEVDICLNNY